jgi:hypothetical protein
MQPAGAEDQNHMSAGSPGIPTGMAADPEGLAASNVALLKYVRW